MSTKPMKKADEELDKALAESFPASDPVSLTRAPRDKHASHRPASRADRKAPKVIRSAEGQPDKKP
jgi:hypothetical protein